MRLPVLLIMAMTAPAFGQFTPPVTPNPLNYGPGRIDASTAYRYIGQIVTACGGAYQSDPMSARFVMGVSPYETVVIFPPNTDPQEAARFSNRNQIICVTGQVTEPQEFMIGVRAVLYPTHIETINPPTPVQSGPCIDQRGMLHGRPTYGGAARQGPIPPC